ncbi:MAG: cell division protein SepF, partial [Butyricicoccus sp.]|nr:cell division protein SepF [Butyricicoccus sp.]
MASLKGFLDWVKGEDMEDDYEEFVPRSQQPAAAAAPSPSAAAPEDSLSYTADTQRSSNKVVNIHATTQ